MRLTLRRSVAHHRAMDATEAAQVYSQALLGALDQVMPQLPPATRAQLCLALQAKLLSAIAQPELLVPTATLLTELGRRGADALAEDDRRRTAAANSIAEDIGRRLGEADRLSRPG